VGSDIKARIEVVTTSLEVAAVVLAIAVVFGIFCLAKAIKKKYFVNKP